MARSEGSGRAAATVDSRDPLRDVHYSLEDGKFWLSEYKHVGQGLLLGAAVFG